MVERQIHRYFLPGGGLEPGETHRDCLTRECAEELGWDIEIQEYLGCVSQYEKSIKSDEYLNIIGHFYTARMTGENHSKIESDHHLAWLEPFCLDEFLTHQL